MLNINARKLACLAVPVLWSLYYYVVYFLNRKLTNSRFCLCAVKWPQTTKSLSNRHDFFGEFILAKYFTR